MREMEELEIAFRAEINRALESHQERYERVMALYEALDFTQQVPLPQIDQSPQPWWRNKNLDEV